MLRLLVVLGSSGCLWAVPERTSKPVLQQFTYTTTPTPAPLTFEPESTDNTTTTHVPEFANTTSNRSPGGAPVTSNTPSGNDSATSNQQPTDGPAISAVSGTRTTNDITKTFYASSFASSPPNQLGATDCSNSSETTGTYQDLRISIPSRTRDEGITFEVLCLLPRTGDAPKKCDDLLGWMLNNTQLYLKRHHKQTNLTHVSYNSRESIERYGVAGISFTFNLSHVLHHYHGVLCSSTRSNLTLISRFLNISRVNKRFPVSLHPQNVEVEIGKEFALTCHTDTEAVSYVTWHRTTSSLDTQYSEIYTSSSHTKIQKDYGSNYSILRVTELHPWKGVYKCTTITSHSWAPFAKASVVVTPPDKRAVTGSAVALSLTAILVVVVLTAVFLRRRALRKKIEISVMLQDVKEEARALAPSASRASLNNMDLAVNNCYSETVDGTASSGTDLLSATFARLTQRYGSWQKDRNTLVIKQILGEGNFGSVCLAIMPDVYLQGISSQVAVKTIKPARMDGNAIVEFEKEIEIMTALRHDSIVPLLGLCTETMPLYIIMEFMENGPLNTFLMENAPNKLEETPLSVQDLLHMSLQPCRAIEYLSNKNIVHRDISARNCLVGRDLIVKLADFGLSRGTLAQPGKDYYKKDGGMVPVKWMSPEALNFGKYTSANDVWACGVLLWELFSFGAIPYQGFSNQGVIVHVNQGGRLGRPGYCPGSVWRHVEVCWEKDVGDRITIGGLVNMLATEMDMLVNS